MNEKIAALETRISQLENVVKLMAMAMAGKVAPATSNENLAWAKQLASRITTDIAAELGIAGIGFDPGMPWFLIALTDGRRISVKKTEFALRIRVRRDGEKIGEDIEMSLNAFPGGLKKIATEVV